MKKYVILSLLAVALTAFISSCGGVANDPESVAKAYLDAVAEMDFDKAKTFCTEETAAMLDMMKGLMGEMDDEKKEEMKNAKREIIKSEEDGDKAVVTYETDDGEQTIELKKVDGDWKVHQEKEEPEAE